MSAARDTPGPGRTLTTLAELPERSLLDEAALAEALQLSKRTIRRMTGRLELPPPIRLGRRSFWVAGRVLDWIEHRAEGSAREAERHAAKLRQILP